MGLMQPYAALLAFDEWANREILASLQQGSAPARAVKLLAHVVGAGQLWWTRLHREPPPCPVWPEWDLARTASEAAALAARWSAFGGERSPALDATIDYVNSKGEPFSNRVADVLLHVAMHGAHHRAQILAELRAAGRAPPYVDFIHAVRTGSVPPEA